MSNLAVIADVGGRRVAFDAAAVESVVDLAAITPIPLAPPHVAGLSALRSRVVTVIDTALALGMGAPCRGHRGVAVVIDGHRYVLRVDGVENVVAPLSTDANPQGLDGKWRAVAKATVETTSGLALMLDPRRLVA